MGVGIGSIFGKEAATMDRQRNRREIIRIIKRKALETKREKQAEETPWDSQISKVEYLQFLRDLEEGRITRLTGKKIG